MTAYILDKAYAIDETNGVGAYRAVVMGTNPGEAKLPAAANAAKPLGITVHSQQYQGGNVAVRKAGIAKVFAAGAIALGAPVIVAGASGKVAAATGNAGTKLNCLGFAETAATADGDLIEIFLTFHERTA
jgi:hypothetical protein